MRSIVWSDAALQEVDRALPTLAAEDERTAILMTDRIETALDLLAERQIGRPGRVTGTYEKRVLRIPYIVAYTLSDEAVVIHARREWLDDAWPRD